MPLRSGSSCSTCPLNERLADTPSFGEIAAPILFLTEEPGEYERKALDPFVGDAGNRLKLALMDTEIPTNRVAKSFVRMCNSAGTTDEQRLIARHRCNGGLRYELIERAHQGLKVVAACGEAACLALGIDGSIEKIHGSVFPFIVDDVHLWVVPTFDAAFVHSHQWKVKNGGRANYYAAWLADFKKISDIGLRGWKPPKENFILSPSVEDVVKFCSEAVAKKSLIACDTETTGVDFYEGDTRGWVIGLASSAEDAICVPIFDYGGVPYWKSVSAWNEVKIALQSVFDACPLIMQNAGFDLRVLRREGFNVAPSRVAHDTLILHSIVSPESRHDLGSIVAEYGATPFWKDMNWTESIAYRDQLALRRYNLRDCVVLLQVVNPMLKHLADLHAEEAYYNEALPLIAPILRMSDAGVLFDVEHQEKFQLLLQEKRKGLLAKMNEIHEKPEAFSYSSKEDVAYWLYGIQGGKFDRARRALAEAEKKREDKVKERAIAREKALAVLEEKRKAAKEKGREHKLTKAEAKLFGAEEPKAPSKAEDKARETLSILRTCSPIYVPPGFVAPLTETGAPSTDKFAIIGLIQAINARIYKLGEMKRDHAEEIERAERSLDWLALFQETQKIQKLADAFLKYLPKPDGRIHPSWNQTGAVSGRLSCSDPNLMQIPKKGEGKEIREFFLSGPGKILVSADFENAEVALLGYETGDEIIINAYESGASIHEINSRTMFGVGSESPDYEKKYKPAAKVFQFGQLSYGGSTRAIYRQILIQAPDLKISLREYEQKVAKWFAEHVRYREWDAAITDLARSTRTVTNAFGRVRILLGNDYDIVKQAKNTMIQSACASLINRAWVRIEARVPEGAVPTFQIHDQLVYECDEKDVDVVAAIIEEEMSKPFMYRGVERRLRAEVEVGKNLGDLKKWRHPDGGIGIAS